MIADQSILCVSNTCWEDPGDLQVIAELLSGANNTIWISPFGGLRSNLLPRIDRLTESLTIYNPGINFLPLPFLEGFNRSRLLLHTRLYLMEKDFEPNLVIFDHPDLLKFANTFKKNGAKTLYYASADKNFNVMRAEKQKAEEYADYFYKARPITGEMSEDEYLEMIHMQINDLSKLLNH